MFKQASGGGKDWRAPIAYIVGAMGLAGGLACPLVAYYMRGSISANGDWIIDAAIYLLFAALIVLALGLVTVPLAIMARSREAAELARVAEMRATGQPMVLQMPTQSAPQLPAPRVEEPRPLGAATPWTVREAGEIVRR